MIDIEQRWQRLAEGMKAELCINAARGEKRWRICILGTDDWFDGYFATLDAALIAAEEYAAAKWGYKRDD